MAPKKRRFPFVLALSDAAYLVNSSESLNERLANSAKLFFKRLANPAELFIKPLANSAMLLNAQLVDFAFRIRPRSSYGVF